jgi:hypothetical protein
VVELLDMDNDLALYVQRLESMAFFSGYPLIYAIVLVVAGQLKETTTFINKLVVLLPVAYAFIGLLFLGFVLKSFYIDYSLKNIGAEYQFSYIRLWGLLGVLFWISAFRKKAIFSLLHSLVFFSFVLRDLFFQITSNFNAEGIKNDMKVYTGSLLLNASVISGIIVIHFISIKIRARKRISIDSSPK